MIRTRTSRLRSRCNHHSNLVWSYSGGRGKPNKFSSQSDSLGPKNIIFMKHLSSIVATNHDGVIGAGNALPWKVKSDMAFFKSTTIGSPIIMGRHTFDSLGQKPLPKRFNIVVTHSLNLIPETENLTAAHSIEEAIYIASKQPMAEEVFVIGGASMYQQFANYVDRYYITMIDKHVPDGDTLFDISMFDRDVSWTPVLLSEGKANDLGDEADFAIFELNSDSSNAIAQRRQIAAHQYENRIRTSPKSKKSRTSGRKASTTIHNLLNFSV